MQKIILFDGICNFCDSSVQFIIKRDRSGQFHFASLQSDAASKLLDEHDVPKDVGSIILIEDGKAYHKSGAALRIARNLDGAWKLLYGFIIVPRPIRDFVYDIIARNRYKWFGQKESCPLPSPDIRKRFLDN